MLFSIKGMFNNVIMIGFDMTLGRQLHNVRVFESYIRVADSNFENNSRYQYYTVRYNYRVFPFEKGVFILFTLSPGCYPLLCDQR